MGISADARGLRLELARLGSGAPQILARGTRAPAAVARVPAATRGGVYVVSQPARGPHVRGAARRARRAARARRAVRDGRPASVLLPYQRRLDALGIRFDAVTLRDAREGVLGGYAVARRACRVDGSIAQIAGIRLVTSLAGIEPGLGT